MGPILLGRPPLTQLAPESRPHGSLGLGNRRLVGSVSGAANSVLADLGTAKPSLDLVPQRGSGLPQAPAFPVRGDLSVIGPMARSAADLEFELAVVAGPDELAQGVGYKLALPPPRHDKLADFRILVIDAHPLCPTAASVRAALNGVAERLGQLGCTILRQSATLPDLAETGRIYRELLTATFAADLPPEARERVEAAAKALSLDEPCGFRLARSDREPGRMDRQKPHPGWAAVALAGVVPGSRRRALPADADRGLPARSLAAIRPTTRH